MQDFDLPYRVILQRSARIPQLIRAAVVVLLGIAVFAAAFTVKTETPAVPNLLRVLGGFVALSGAIALLLLFIATLREQKRVILADENGLTVEQAGKNKQSLQWAEVGSYEIEYGGGLTGIDTFLTSPSTGRTDGDDLLGCFFGILLALYFGLLEFFVRGASWKVKFKLKSRRSLNISGYGASMDVLVEKILPQVLPNKRKLPDEKKKTAPANKTE